MKRTEPGTAGAAVAVSVGATALRGQAGGAALPPGILQPLVPVALALGRFALDSAVGGAWILLLVSPMGFAAADDGGLTLTVSIGLAQAAVSMPNIDALMKAADRALYQAKAAGRDRAVVAAPRADEAFDLAAE